MPELECPFPLQKHSLKTGAEDICSVLGLPDIVVPRLLNSPLPLQCLAAEALPDQMKREIQLITNEFVSPQEEQPSESSHSELQSEPSCVLKLAECIVSCSALFYRCTTCRRVHDARCVFPCVQNECMALVQSDADAKKIIVPKRLFLNGE